MGDRKTRENRIQSLLRHAFVCSHNKDCSCARNIKDFLQNDKISKEWVEERMGAKK